MYEILQNKMRYMKNMVWLRLNLAWFNVPLHCMTWLAMAGHDIKWHGIGVGTWCAKYDLVC